MFELRIDHGQGWRVFYGIESGRVVLLLAGSDKSGQKSAIKTARKRLKNWQQRNLQ
ncbi:MAG: type II toxin-antitoxin system RelE/ParE family toxin [Rhodoferax sp.]|nr:type II toxin-antitoxin system RelE/ParE family toxin [Rhodoferax sp.]